MNVAATAVAGDWGTSHLRLFLCRGAEILQGAHGPGIAELGSSTTGADPEARDSTFRSVLSGLLAPWIEQHGRLPVWLAGMVGSRNGWRETPYVGCPANATAIVQGVVRIEVAGLGIALVPGLRCVSPTGAPDVMRGEETQVIGALALEPDRATQRRLLALPGTHTKWVLVDGAQIVRFQTAFSGELFGLLRDRSMLARVAGSSATPRPIDRSGFDSGLARCRAQRGVPLTHLLFEVRSRQLLAEMSADSALGFLSGLIIGQDVQGALASFGPELHGAAGVTLIGDPALTDLYRVALAAEGISARAIDAAAASVAGLHHFTSTANANGPARATGS